MLCGGIVAKGIAATIVVASAAKDSCERAHELLLCCNSPTMPCPAYVLQCNSNGSVLHCNASVLRCICAALHLCYQTLRNSTPPLLLLQCVEMNTNHLDMRRTDI